MIKNVYNSNLMTDHLVDISTTFSTRNHHKDSNYAKKLFFIHLYFRYFIVNRHIWC